MAENHIVSSQGTADTAKSSASALKQLVAIVDTIGDRVRTLIAINLASAVWFYADMRWIFQWERSALYIAAGLIIPSILLLPILWLIRSLQEIDETVGSLKGQLVDTKNDLKQASKTQGQGLIRQLFRMRTLMAVLNAGELSGYYGTMVMLANPISLIVTLIATITTILLAAAAMVRAALWAIGLVF